jgi:hypothetical protein
MKKLKIINHSGLNIGVAMFSELQQSENGKLILNDGEINYPCDRKNLLKKICLILSPTLRVFLSSFFMETNKIAYVRKGAGDDWFVDPIHRKAKLVKKWVCNRAPSQITVAEFVLEQKEGIRPPGSSGPPWWTAWWETNIDSMEKRLVIVVVGQRHRNYFVRGGGLPLVGNNPDVEVLRQQNNNQNIHQIEASPDEHVEVKEIRDGLLNLKSSRRPPFWSKLSL